MRGNYAALNGAAPVSLSVPIFAMALKFSSDAVVQIVVRLLFFVTLVQFDIMVNDSNVPHALVEHGVKGIRIWLLRELRPYDVPGLYEAFQLVMSTLSDLLEIPGNSDLSQVLKIHYGNSINQGRIIVVHALQHLTAV